MGDFPFTIMISVIISTYNRPKLLKRAIKSVLNQSFKDFEIIVVDDHSDKKANFNNPKIKYFYLDENHGSDSYPKNFGISKAKGNYIAFLDDDDTFRRDALKILYNYITLSEADIVYGDYINHNKEKSAGWSVDFNLQILAKMNYIAMSTVLVKKDALLEVGGFDENVPRFKDWNLWIRLAKRGFRFLHISIPVVDVYYQKKSISKKYNVKCDKWGFSLPTFFDPADCPIYASKTLLGEEKPLKVALFTLTMNRLDYTKDCFAQIKKTAGYPYTHFVIDNNSTDGTKEWLKSQNLLTKFFDVNKGIGGGWNEAVDWIGKKYDIIVKIDNDCYPLTKDWLKEMVEIFRRSRKVILSPAVEGLENNPGGVLRERQGGSPYVMINDKILGIVPYLGGICFASPIELYDNWRFDEDMKGNKDFILSQYAKEIGYQLMYLEEARVWHYEDTAGQWKRYGKK